MDNPDMELSFDSDLTYCQIRPMAPGLIEQARRVQIVRDMVALEKDRAEERKREQAAIAREYRPVEWKRKSSDPTTDELAKLAAIEREKREESGVTFERTAYPQRKRSG